jgi:hypothetical protein
MLQKKKKQPKFPKNIGGKKADLKKPNMPVDTRKFGNVKRGDHRDYLSWFHNQCFTCLECSSPFIEADHINPQDDRTVVPFCSYCHRGDERQGRPVLAPSGATKERFEALHLGDMPRNTYHFVTKGFYRTRGTRMAEFKKRWPDDVLLKIAQSYHQKYLNEKG